MHIPEIFEEKDQSRILAFIREHSFGIIVSYDGAKPVATHTPLLVQRKNNETVLLGHIAARNGQTASLPNGMQVLCIFNGPHAYVSPQWYAEMDAPDWNYRAAHVYGTIRHIEGRDVMARMSEMTDHYEAGFEKPARTSDIPPDVLQAALQEIFVFEVVVERLEAIARLSQDHSDASHRNITHNLKQHDDFNALLVAFEMERRKKK